MIGICILGSTGSIGINTLNVIAAHPDRFRVIALTAQRNIEKLYQQCLQFQPIYAVLPDPILAQQLQQKLQQAKLNTEVIIDLEKVVVLPEVNYVMAAIVGAAGLLPTLTAVRAKKRVLLANKEALVMAGELFMAEVQRQGVELLPVDSEHNAIFQCLPTDFRIGKAPAGVNRIVLTASGGPFRETPLDKLATVTPEQACAHPNWKMGKKISVDSATMLNKGLEVIEAHWLFGLAAEKIDVLLHPQSIIHSLVEYVDGSFLAQLGNPDMRTPITYSLAWPNRIASGVKSLDLATLSRLDFAGMDFNRYPCLKLAYDALRAGGTASTILNAANEIAVQAFLDNKISFINIATVVAETLQKIPVQPANSLETILESDLRAREVARIVLF